MERLQKITHITAPIFKAVIQMFAVKSMGPEPRIGPVTAIAVLTIVQIYRNSKTPLRRCDICDLVLSRSDAHRYAFDLYGAQSCEAPTLRSANMAPASIGTSLRLRMLRAVGPYCAILDTNSNKRLNMINNISKFFLAHE
jgi:hypothetical protein